MRTETTIELLCLPGPAQMAPPFCTGNSEGFGDVCETFRR